MSTWVFLAQMTQDNTDLREIVKAIILPAPNKKGHPTILGSLMMMFVIILLISLLQNLAYRAYH